MKKLYICAAALAMTLAACNNEEFVEISQQEGLTSISAVIEQTNSRVNIGALQNDEYPLTWSASTNVEEPNGDFLTVFGYSEGSTEMECMQYYYTGEDNAVKGTFEKPAWFETGLSKIEYAIANVSLFYPGQTITFNSSEISSMIAEPAFNGRRFPMYGEMKDGQLHFHQVIGLLKLNLKGDDIKVGDYLVATCDENHVISGEGTMEIPEGAPQNAKLVLDEYGERVAAFPVEMLKDGSFFAYVALPLGSYDSLSFKIARKKMVGGVEVVSESKPVLLKSKSGNKLVIEKNIYAYDLTFGTLDGPAPLKASLPGSDSRIAFDKNNLFVWAPGDEISVFKSAATFENKIDFGVNLPEDAKIGKATEEFLTANVYDMENVVYGVYPSNQVQAGGDDYLNVFADKMPKIPNVLKNFVMLGKYDSSKQVMKFESTMGLLKIILPENWWSSKDAEGKEIIADGLQVVANRPIAIDGYNKAQLRLSDGVVVIPEGKGTNTITLDRVYGSFKGTEVYCALPVGTDYTSLSIKTAKKGGYGKPWAVVQDLVTKDIKEVKKGMVYTINLVNQN